MGVMCSSLSRILLKESVRDSLHPPLHSTVCYTMGVSKLSERRSNKVVAPWKEIEALFCAGHTSKAIGDEYGVCANTIRKRSLRENWPTVGNLKRQAASLLAKAHEAELGSLSDNPVDALVARVADQKITHQNAVLDITAAATAKMKKELSDPKSSFKLIKSAHDFELVDRVARRNLGLDQEDLGSGLSVNITAFSTPPTPMKQAEGYVVD